MFGLFANKTIQKIFPLKCSTGMRFFHNQVQQSIDLKNYWYHSISSCDPAKLVSILQHGILSKNAATQKGISLASDIISTHDDEHEYVSLSSFEILQNPKKLPLDNAIFDATCPNYMTAMEMKLKNKKQFDIMSEELKIISNQEPFDIDQTKTMLCLFLNKYLSEDISVYDDDFSFWMGVHQSMKRFC